VKRFFFYGVFACGALLGSSCSSDGDNGTDAFWNEAKLNDFPLFEVTYLDIDIIHPEIKGGIETKPGKIAITVPFSQTSLMLSLKQFGLDQSKYAIEPRVGERQDFSKGAVTYTVSDVMLSTKAVHYEVTVTHGGDPFFTNTKITGFKFEKAKNPALAATIEAVKIAEYDNYTDNAIYVIVPEGTDFSQLTPTITYDAARLYYNIDTQFVPYPANAPSVDFTYPKHFYLQAENSLGEKSRPYIVVVDVANPIHFDTPLVTPNVKADDGSTFENFFAVATWTNRGNHPITGLSPAEYNNKIYPAGYTGDIDIITTSIVNPNAGTTGVLPGQKGEINVRVRRFPLAGLYSTTAVFVPTFSFDTRSISYWPASDRVEDIFDNQSLVIQTTIEE
jgi:hypothetical protein